MYNTTIAANRACLRLSLPCRLPITAVAAALLAGPLAAIPALGQGQAVYSYSAMPNAGFLDVDRPPGCHHPFPTITVSAGGRDVVMTTTRGEDMGQPYYMGCFQWDFASATQYRDPIDPTVNPGNFRGHFQQNGNAQGDLILDFSEPLTGFGISSMLEGVFFRQALTETVIAYDGPTGTGNVLGTATVSMTDRRLRVVFLGVVVPTPQIRSARVPLETNFSIDGYAVGVAGGTPPCPADINFSGGLSVQDIFDFLAAYFAGDQRGDFNGVGGHSVQDIFDFLAAYFAGC